MFRRLLLQDLYRVRGNMFARPHKVGLTSHIRNGNFVEVWTRSLLQQGQQMGGVAFIIHRHDVLLMRSEKPASGNDGPVVRWPCGDMKRALRPRAFNCSHPYRRSANPALVTTSWLIVAFGERAALAPVRYLKGL
jgi:hypothetical protein